MAAHVRNQNEALWAPDAEYTPTPADLIEECLVVDEFISVDERMWVRVYLDRSALDQHGHVMPYAPNAAATRRLPIAA
jgi:hypothetical protein